MTKTQETRRPTFPSLKEPPYSEVSYGLPFTEACKKYVDQALHAERVYIIASNTLAKKTDKLQKLQDALGSKVVGTSTAIKMHTSLDDLFPIAKEVNEKNADCIVTLGGGSLGDGAQIVALAAANNALTPETLIPLQFKFNAPPQHIKAPTVPLIFIPTTLAGAEYSRYAAGTNSTTHEKHMFGHSQLYAKLVILDPTVTLSMPLNTWIASGVRAVDHCVEGTCSKYPQAESDVAYAEGLRLLVPGLFATLKDPSDEQARLSCMLGCNLSMIGLVQSVPKGASHGIGHQLGPLGVGHGETSCILNPAVMKYNKVVNGGRQDRVKEILWEEDVAGSVLRDAGLKKKDSDLGDATRVIFDALGMPRSLKGVGVGRDKWKTLAENSLRDDYCRANPVPLEREEQVTEILEMVAGDRT